MKKTIIWFLIVISILSLIIRYSSKMAEVFLGIKQRSGITIFTLPDGATVFLDGKEVGKTPYENKNLEVKQYDVKLERDGAYWQGKIKLNSGTLTSISRDLSPAEASAAGEILTLERGKGLTVISNPSDANVEIDGKLFGKTPQTFDIGKGEHTILISHSNYLNRSIKVNLPDKFNMTISVDLSLSEADLTSVSAPVITQTPEVVVKQTPTGFLRVRDKASLSGKEIDRVNTGDTLILLEELSGWDRVRLVDGTEGFVSSTYVTKKNP